MAAPSLIKATSFFLRASRASFRPSRTAHLPLSKPILRSANHFPIRTYSSQTAPTPRKLYSFDQISSIAASPSPSTLLIDAREPHELAATGTIPGALNIPITTQPDAFSISKEEFRERYGREVPGEGMEVVFFCRAGVRSRAAAEMARRAGWMGVGEYEGSWLEWEGKGGNVERR